MWLERFYITNRVTETNCWYGFDQLPELIQIIVNTAWIAKHQQNLGA
jgi:hypothetical protein